MGPDDPIFREQRMITEIPGIEREGANLLRVFGIGDIALPSCTIDAALSIPSVWAAVSFLSRTLAALPLHAYRSTSNGPKKISGGLEDIVHNAPNEEWTSFKFRQHFWQQVFTGGRGLGFIDRTGANIHAMWPVDPSKVKIERSAKGKTSYKVGEKKPYAANEIIDVPFMLKADGLSHYSPIVHCAETIQISLAMRRYGAKFFAGGGVPPLGLYGPLPVGPEAMKRAMADVQRAIDAARDSSVPIVQLPPGYELKPIGFDPEKGQMTDARRFEVEEIARIYNLPPVFLQDLTHGTFSNTEQQDLQLVKHLVAHWAQALEQEMNLKFGKKNIYVEHNLDGLMRGDLLSRMQAHGQAVQNSIRTPNEVRELENLSPKPGGDDLMIQGATIPLKNSGQQQEPGTPPPADGGLDDDGA
jgi:HK97 family phage portal protein